jgi:hypothetical protein
MTLLLLIYSYQLFALLPTADGSSLGSVAPQLSSAGRNQTKLKTDIAPAWVLSASYRGTSDILWSCIITLLACVYSALHLNVPSTSLGGWQVLWRKIQWVGLALFAPELVLYVAYSQYVDARDLVKELNRLRLGDDKSVMRRRASKVFDWHKRGDEVSSRA